MRWFTISVLLVMVSTIFFHRQNCQLANKNFDYRKPLSFFNHTCWASLGSWNKNICLLPHYFKSLDPLAFKQFKYGTWKESMSLELKISDNMPGSKTTIRWTPNRSKDERRDTAVVHIGEKFWSYPRILAQRECEGTMCVYNHHERQYFPPTTSWRGHFLPP